MVISLLDMAGLLFVLHPRLLQGLGFVRAHRQGEPCRCMRLLKNVGSHCMVNGLYGHLLGQGGSGFWGWCMCWLLR